MAVEPDVILMDEPASALDPISTARIEDLIHELKQRVHDRDRHPQHAAGRPRRRHDGVLQRRASDEDGTRRHGILVEYDATTKIFTNPSDKRTEDYVTGRFG